jgi:hypothetical protein
MTSEPRTVPSEAAPAPRVPAPVGVALSAVGLAIGAVRAGCTAVRAGVDRFREEVERQVRDDRARSEARRAGAGRRDAPGRPSRAVRTAGSGASVSPSTPAASSGVAPVDLALPDYDHLPASQIVALLGDLDSAELDSIEAYERAHRHRRTVLGKLDQLRAER